MSKRITGSILLAITVGVAIVFAGLTVLAAKQEPSNQNTSTQPTNTKQVNRSKRGSASTKNAKTAGTTEATGDQTMPATTQEAPTATTTPTRKHRQRASNDMATTTAQSVQTDLSGTYAGTFKCDDIGLTGDTTLTINGNQFTTADGKSGRIVASTTGGYTAVALQMGDPTAAAPGTTPTVVSLRARKSGDRLTLMPIAGASSPCSFTPARAVASRRTRRSQQTATGTEVASPAEAGPAPTEVTTPATPSRRNTRKGTKSRTGTTTPAAPPSAMPTATPSESPATAPVPTQSPIPSPSPTPSESPSPVPSPSGSPTASPTPEATPSPSPSPSPSPAPKRP
jgi:hypothetical protein